MCWVALDEHLTCCTQDLLSHLSLLYPTSPAPTHICHPSADPACQQQKAVTGLVKAGQAELLTWVNPQFSHVDCSTVDDSQ